MVEPLLFCGDLVDGESSAGKNFSGRILCSGALCISKRFAAGLMRVTDCVMLECRVELAFVVGASVIPHPDKVEKGGEDAYFIHDYGGGVLGVADGVSG
jgi:hypothetical protein